MAMPTRYQLARPTRLNQSGMKPCTKGLVSGTAADTGPASAGDASACFLKNFTAAP